MNTNRWTFLLSVIVSGMVLFSGCGSGEGSGENENQDSVQVIKVDPGTQHFPVNDIPDSYFGKERLDLEGKSMDDFQGNLLKELAKAPDWLDAIISRESVVLFGKKILAVDENAVSFDEKERVFYSNKDGEWKGFVFKYTAQPSGQSMFIFGGYKNEEVSFWASDVFVGMDKMELTHVSGTDTESMIAGKLSDNAGNEKMFLSKLTKESFLLRLGE